MDLKLKGKRAFVSGSTAGIGYAVALGLAREGAEVVVNGRTDARVSDAIKRIAGGTATTVSGIAADLGSAAGVDRLLSELGNVDILANNIGIFEPKPFLEIPDVDWLRFFETNVMSGVRLSRSLLPYMIEQGWGRVIFVSSEFGAEYSDRDGAARAMELAMGPDLNFSVTVKHLFVEQRDLAEPVTLSYPTFASAAEESGISMLRDASHYDHSLCPSR